MVTNIQSNVCPECGSVNLVTVLDYFLLDNDIELTLQCKHCNHVWQESYGLMYLGYTDNGLTYDRYGVRTSANS